MLSPKVVADHILNNFDVAKSVRIDEAIEATVRHLDRALSELSVYEFSENNEELIRRRIDAMLESLANAGRFLPFEVVNGRYLQGSDWKRRDAPENPRLTLSRVRAGIKGLTDAEFESLGGPALRVLGCHIAEQTIKTRDGGADWYGNRRLNIKALDVVEALVAVDCKNCDYSVGYLRAFESSVATAVRRKLNNEQSKIPASVNVRSQQPRLLLVMCSGRVSPDARRLAGEIGAALLESDHLSKLLFRKLDKELSPGQALTKLIQ